MAMSDEVSLMTLIMTREVETKQTDETEASDNHEGVNKGYFAVERRDRLAGSSGQRRERE